jgi:hypothetical protein
MVQKEDGNRRVSSEGVKKQGRGREHLEEIMHGNDSEICMSKRCNVGTIIGKGKESSNEADIMAMIADSVAGLTICKPTKMAESST